MPPSLTTWLLEKKQVRRLRKEAYAAVQLGEPFHESSASFAELALLRALTLERELRRASLLRSRESVAAMARGVIESVLRGMYVLVEPDDARGRLEVETRGHLRKMSVFGDARLGHTLHNAAVLLGEDFHRGMPDLRQVAEAVDNHYGFHVFPEQRLGAYLYHDWYLPLSNLSVHPSLPALSRYYRFRTRIIRRKPWGIIPRRGATRMADGSIAYLAIALNDSLGRESAWLNRYASRQLKMANIPMVVLWMRAAIGQGPAILLRTAATAIRVRDAFDDNAPRAKRIDAIRAIQRAAHPDATDEELDQLAEAFVDGFDMPNGSS